MCPQRRPSKSFFYDAFLTFFEELLFYTTAVRQAQPDMVMVEFTHGLGCVLFGCKNGPTTMSEPSCIQFPVPLPIYERKELQLHVILPYRTLVSGDLHKFVLL